MTRQNRRLRLTPLRVAIGLVIFVIVSYLVIQVGSRAGAGWTREVVRDVPEASLENSVRCGPVSAGGIREPSQIEGLQPPGFEPAFVQWCRMDGLVETTQWAPEWSVRLQAPDEGFLFEPIAEGDCDLLQREPLYFLVINKSGDGYRQRVPHGPCGDELPAFRNWAESLPWQESSR